LRFSARKERRYLNPEDWMPTLLSYFGGMGRNHRILAIASGGIANHVHRWIALPSDICVAKAVQVLKANSSRWLGEPGITFAWREG
jgi:hypothetical protein